MSTETTLVLLFPHEYILKHELDNLLKTGTDIESLRKQFVKEVRSLRETCDGVCLVPAYFWNGQMVEIADVFLPDVSDRVINSGVRIRLEDLTSDDPDELVWDPEEPDFAPIIDAIDSSILVIGGFHFVDCVFMFLLAAKEAGKKAVVALKTTDFLFVHHGLAHLGRPVKDEIPPLADFNQYSALLRHYLSIIDYPDE